MEFEKLTEQCFEKMTDEKSNRFQFFPIGHEVYKGYSGLSLQSVEMECQNPNEDKRYLCFRNVTGDHKDFKEDTRIDYFGRL